MHTRSAAHDALRRGCWLATPEPPPHVNASHTHPWRASPTAQVCLQSAGYYCGEDDMRWWQFGSSTLDALKTFQVRCVVCCALCTHTHARVMWRAGML
jgi:hypothetical protein